jgi:DNA methylase
MDWKTVSEKIVQDDQNKWDQTWLAEELEVAKLGNDVWPFSDLAMSQFCQKLDIPVRYFRRLPDEMKITVANYDLERLKGTSFLVRSKGDWIRAFLSAEYVAYNNSEIADTVQGLLGNGALTMKSFVLEETHMFLKIISEEIWDVESGLKAGCPEMICKKCGTARKKIYEGRSNQAFNIRVRDVQKGRIKAQEWRASEEEQAKYQEKYYAKEERKEFKGYTDCGCSAGWTSGIVLDPFMGSGTTAVVAETLGRRWIGIELNPKYITIARRRLTQTQNVPQRLAV